MSCHFGIDGKYLVGERQICYKREETNSETYLKEIKVDCE